VTGTPRKMAFGDGWTFYQMPWRQWAKGAVVNYAAYPVYSPDLVKSLGHRVRS
jgi:hypothetical protein